MSSTTSPLPLPLWWERKAEGEEHNLPPSSPAAWERKAEGEEHNLPPSSPAAWERKGARGEGEGPPALRGTLTPSPSPALRERGV